MASILYKGKTAIAGSAEFVIETGVVPVVKSVITVRVLAELPLTIDMVKNVAVTSGTCTLTIKINDTPIGGLESIAVTSSPQAIVATGANTAFKNDIITWEFTNISSAVNFSGELQVSNFLFNVIILNALDRAFLPTNIDTVNLVWIDSSGTQNASFSLCDLSTPDVVRTTGATSSQVNFNSALHHPTDDFSISFYGYTNSGGGFDFLLSSFGTTNTEYTLGANAYVFWNTGRHELFTDTNTTASATFPVPTTTPSTSSYNFYTLTRSGSSFKSYINGVFQGEVILADPIGSGGANFYGRLRRTSATGTRYTNAYIKYLHSYDREISAAEVLSEYNYVSTL